MARRQYRIVTDSDGVSNFGFAYVALVNPSGSGKKFIIRSVEVALHASYDSALGMIATARIVRCGLPTGGEDMARKLVLSDSANAWPSTCRVRRNSELPGTQYLLRRVNIQRGRTAGGAYSRLIFGSQGAIGQRKKQEFGGLFDAPNLSGDVEGFIIQQNECVALWSEDHRYTGPAPRRVGLRIKSGSSVAYADFVVNCMPGLALCSIENTSATPVTVLSMSVSEMGSGDTPTLQVVPIGQLYASDVNDASRFDPNILPMDSSYPTFPGKVYGDIGFSPFGVPEIALSAGSAGSPKGVNYLHSKDFWGPAWRTVFVEPAHLINTPAIPGTLGYSFSPPLQDLLARKAGITLNEGEGLAITNTAETATTGAQYGGWAPMTFALQVDVQPAKDPYLVLSNIVPGSDIVILTAGTGTILQAVDSTGLSSYSWGYDPESVVSVDVCVYKAGYKDFSARGVALGLGGAGIIVQQRFDAAYI